tara:strand:+ start:18 stop:254 length:237 start_codon:yes stop_codon:yes gene_type:complete
MDNLLEITLEEYHYTLTEDYQQLITRNGEPWRDETGDNLIYAMAQKINSLEEELGLAVEIIDDSGIDYEEVLEIKRGE